jgi:hypothetical protein
MKFCCLKRLRTEFWAAHRCFLLEKFVSASRKAKSSSKYRLTLCAGRLQDCEGKYRESLAYEWMEVNTLQMGAHFWASGISTGRYTCNSGGLLGRPAKLPGLSSEVECQGPPFKSDIQSRVQRHETASPVTREDGRRTGNLLGLARPTRLAQTVGLQTSSVFNFREGFRPRLSVRIRSRVNVKHLIFRWRQRFEAVIVSQTSSERCSPSSCDLWAAQKGRPTTIAEHKYGFFGLDIRKYLRHEKELGR